jgi:glycine cleavage system H protein
MDKIPTDLRYSPDHHWVRIEADVAYVGITDYAQETLGEVVYVELPPVGDFFAARDEIATLESVKAASSVYNPIAGTVASVNEELEGSPELVNEDCYEHHLYTLTDFDLAAVDALLDAPGYAEFLETLEES